MDNYEFRDKARIVGCIDLIFSVVLLLVGMYEMYVMFDRDYDLLRRVADATKWRQTYLNILPAPAGDIMTLGGVIAFVVGVFSLQASLVLIRSTEIGLELVDAAYFAMWWKDVNNYLYQPVGFLLASAWWDAAVIKIIPNYLIYINALGNFGIPFLVLRPIFFCIVGKYQEEIERAMPIDAELEEEPAKAA